MKVLEVVKLKFQRAQRTRVVSQKQNKAKVPNFQYETYETR